MDRLQPAKTTPPVDFVILTALREELDAVLNKFPDFKQLPPDSDSIYTYYQVDLPITFSDNSAGKYRVVATCLISMGRVQAVAAASEAIRKWNPRFLIMVGIAGGVAARKVQIGDVLVSDLVVDYELQKITPEGPEIRWDIHRADVRLLNACNNFRSESWRKLIQVKRPLQGEISVYTGPIASGDKVIALNEVISKYRTVWPKLIGVEMEAAGAATAACQSPYAPGFFMVRGVSDLADNKKNTKTVEKWRSYACDVAASFAIGFLKSGPVPLSKISEIEGVRSSKGHRSSEAGKIIIPRYTVGNISTNVYMDLIGGGDEVFDKKSIYFDYVHDFIPLPKPIERDREAVIGKLEQKTKESGTAFFNGPAIRLHSYGLNIKQCDDGEERKEPILHLRPTCWYDFALSNNRLDDQIYIPGKGFSTIRREYADEERLVLERTIDSIELTNILCITVVLTTRDNWTLVGIRTKLVDNYDRQFATTCAENIHRWKDEPSSPSDFWSPSKAMLKEKGSNISWDYCPNSCPNPFFTAIRGIKEEVSEEVAKLLTVNDISFLSVAWNIEKFQPHLIAIVSVDMTINELKDIVNAKPGSDMWEATLLPVPFSPTGELRDLLFERQWAEISKSAIMRSLVHKYGYKDVDKALR
jgi:nucleoside phosphorylase